MFCPFASRFQSTRPRGARRQRVCVRIAECWFQSTRPRGARRNVAGVAARNGSFNPRAHAGRDYLQPSLAVLQMCFNPRAHAGRDSIYSWRLSRTSCFNPRAHAGRDAAKSGAAEVGIAVSIHAPTRGATSPRRLSIPRAMFQSTRPRGARREPRHRRYPRNSFNPRAHAGRDVPHHLVLTRVEVSIHAPTRGAT